MCVRALCVRFLCVSVCLFVCFEREKRERERERERERIHVTHVVLEGRERRQPSFVERLCVRVKRGCVKNTREV